MATVLFKVFALTLKTLSKPLAAQFEKSAMSHPLFRERAISLAQRLHRLEIWLARGAEGKGGKVFVGDMTEEKALQLASKVASEGFLYTTGIALVLLEMDRKRREDLAKKEAAAAERQSQARQHAEHRDAEQALQEQARQLAELMQSVDERLRALEERLSQPAEAARRRWLPF